MFSFIALSWDNTIERHRHVANLLSDAISTQRAITPYCVGEGFELLVEPRRMAAAVQRLPTGDGLILGDVFPVPGQAGPIQPLRIDTEQARRIIDSRGQWLTRHAWGNYIALLAPRDAPDRYLITSPGGDLPCHLCHHRGVTLAFSDIQPLLAIQALGFRINDDYLTSKLALGGMTAHSPIMGVRRVYRGECVNLNADADQPRRFHWHPCEFMAAAAPLENATEAGKQLRAIVHSCTQALAGRHDSVLLRLSGGLDSSIIAGCLRTRRHDNELASYTYYSPGARSQELHWAASVARHNALRHIPCPISPADIPLQLGNDIGTQIEPTPTLLYILRSTLEQRLADDCHATAVFTGDGGDSGFCGDSYAYALAEHLQHHGLSWRMFPLAARIGALTNQSAWTVLRRSIRRWRRGADMQQHHQLIAPTSRLLNPDLLRSVQTQHSHPHPWFAQLPQVPWPLIRRLGMLTSVPQPYSVATPATAPQVIAPLYAQPVIELLLKIPGYVHFLDGRERGLARHAFQDDLPIEVARRRWKDRPAHFSAGLIESHRAFLRDTLLDGELVRRHLLNRPAVEAALSTRTTGNAVHPIETLKYLDYEFWLRGWRQPAP